MCFNVLLFGKISVKNGNRNKFKVKIVRDDEEGMRNGGKGRGRER